jgi:hypothetical protein
VATGGQEHRLRYRNLSGRTWCPAEVEHHARPAKPLGACDQRDQAEPCGVAAGSMEDGEVTISGAPALPSAVFDVAFRRNRHRLGACRRGQSSRDVRSTAPVGSGFHLVQRRGSAGPGKREQPVCFTAEHPAAVIASYSHLAESCAGGPGRTRSCADGEGVEPHLLIRSCLGYKILCVLGSVAKRLHVRSLSRVHRYEEGRATPSAADTPADASLETSPDEEGAHANVIRDTRACTRRRGARAVAGCFLVVLASACVATPPTRSSSSGERPADESTPPKPPGIFSEVGGWITYGNRQGIWAVDPTRPDDPNSQIQLSTEIGTPLAWSTDGSKLLILSYERPGSPVPNRLYVLNADGTETTLTTGCSYCISGGSFSPDGSQVIYTKPEHTWRPSIYVVDTQGGTPRVLLTGSRRKLPSAGVSRISWLSDPTYSPDGTQIAYFDHMLDSSAQLRVMNADGTGVRVLLHRAGLPPSTGYHIYHSAWSPDGERLAWGGASGIFIVGADGSGLTLAIPGARYPYWSPDGTRIAYRIYQGGRPNACPSCEIGTLEIAAPDGTHVQEFPSADPGPWNPLVQPPE